MQLWRRRDGHTDHHVECNYCFLIREIRTQGEGAPRLYRQQLLQQRKLVQRQINELAELFQRVDARLQFLLLNENNETTPTQFSILFDIESILVDIVANPQNPLSAIQPQIQEDSDSADH